MLLDIYGPNLRHTATPHGETFVVHAAGCAHGKRAELRSAPKHTEDHPSLTSVCDDYYPPSDFDCASGEYLHDFHVAPCAAKLPT